MRKLGSIIPMFAASVWLLCGLAEQASATTHPADRNGFMIGFGVGGASLGIKDGGSREGSVTGNFRIGYAVRTEVVLHYEGNAWIKTFSEGFGDVTWTFSTSTFAVTYFPGNAPIFLRGGIGFGTANVEVKTQGVKVSDSETGLGLLVAAGGEWRLTKKFALAPQVEFAYQDLDTLGSSNMIGGGLGFNWYW